MPPKRKAPAESADGNTSKATNTSNKKSRPSLDSQETPNNDDDSTPESREALMRAILEKRAKRFSAVSASKNLDKEYYHKTVKKPIAEAYEYICICDPAKVAEEDNDEEPEYAEGEKKCDGGETCPCSKPSTEVPSHPYIITRAGITRNNISQNMNGLRQPESFGMYTYNDAPFYGALEVVQNIILDFDTAFKEDHWREVWATVEGMALFLLWGGGDMMYNADDGERIDETAGLLARMVVTAFAVLEKEGKLGEVKNAGWMISLWLKIVGDMADMGLLEGGKDKPATKTFKFNPSDLGVYLNNIARAHGITVPGETEEDDSVVMPTKTNTKEAWGWTLGLKTYSKGVKLGGDRLDVTTWAAKDRKAAAFDKKDPLPKDLTKKLKEGLVFAPA